MDWKDTVDDASFTKLLENLKTSSHKLRSEAAIELGKLGDARAVDHLIEALNDKNLYVWQKVVEALERIGEKAVLPLIEALKDDTVGERELVTSHQVFYDTYEYRYDVRINERMDDKLINEDDKM
jgi:HEAT repeat protein